MYRFIFLFIITCLINFGSFAQKTHKLTDLFIQAIEGDSVVYTNRNDSISREKLNDLFGIDLFTVLNEKDYRTDSGNRIIINNPIELKGNIIKKKTDVAIFKLQNFHFKKPVYIQIEPLDKLVIAIENCVFQDNIIIDGKDVNEEHSITILNTLFHGNIQLKASDVNFNNNIITKRENAKFVSNAFKTNPLFFHYFDFSYYHDLLDSISFLNEEWNRGLVEYKKRFSIDGSKQISFSNNTIDDFTKINLSGGLEELYISNNQISGIIDLSNLIIDNRLIINTNYLNGYLNISSTVFPEVYRKIKWADSSQFKLVISKNKTIEGTVGLENKRKDSISFSRLKTFSMIDKRGDSIIFDNEIYYLGETSKEVKDDLIYDLKASYQKLSEIYKENADQQAANWAYAEMMNLEGKRLKEVYKEDKNFRNFFRWQLNSLMRVYTNHGTDPALAITISMYVILFFALIYFFFPSEWDVTSKSKLISDFKNFREKNDKGYLVPFLSLIVGLVVSLINALTLSLNSFTTLGFGNIPTKGLARYLTIIQGFVGWFLLGLFSVSLINQVLA